jgi:antitoxin (DNA-binding transcriptional repressor) of toxin-antitoxin stability system
MTIRVDIAKQDALAELVAHVRAGEEVVLTSDGETVGIVVPPPPVAPKGQRRLGIWEHLELDIPDSVFFDPDLELEAMMDESVFPKD